jgi:hypothetical protein
MKRLKKIILGVVYMLLSFALSHATDIHQHEVKQEGEVKFAWEGTTELTEDQDKKDCVIKYHLYVTGRKIKEKNPSKIDDLPEPEVIIGSEAEKIFDKSPGKYYIGVATAIYCPSKKEKISDIAWSHDKSYTNGNPFLVKVVEDEEPKKIE